MRKHPFLTGTIILTAAGIITRFIGFYFRIFLSRTFSDADIGIYQLTMPVMSVVYALTAASYQTVISKFTAENYARGEYGRAHRMFLTATAVSVLSALLAGILVIRFRHIIAGSVLHAPKVAPILYVLGFSFPFSSLHTCINGFYYGRQKTMVPALSQLIEQTVRVLTVCLMAAYAAGHAGQLTLTVAMSGIVSGELFASLFVILFLPRLTEGFRTWKRYITGTVSGLYTDLFRMLTPLTLNRIFLSMMNAAETILLPVVLKQNGLSADSALATYGVLTGMAMPVILFPSAVPSSAATLLLPKVSDMNKKPDVSIAPLVRRALAYSLIYGILCMFICILFGPLIGTGFFHNPSAGIYIRSLSILCPFLYTGITLLSILHGLGETMSPFLCNLAALSIRILCTMLFVPRYGITAYRMILTGYSILTCILYYLALHPFMRYNKQDKKSRKADRKYI